MPLSHRTVDFWVQGLLGSCSKEFIWVSTLDYNIEESDNTRIVYINGSLKFGDHAIVDAVSAALQETGVAELIVDLDALSKLDSYGIGVLLKIDQLAKDSNIPMAVRNVHGTVAEIFSMFQLNEELNVI